MAPFPKRACPCPPGLGRARPWRHPQVARSAASRWRLHRGNRGPEWPGESWRPSERLPDMHEGAGGRPGLAVDRRIAVFESVEAMHALLGASGEHLLVERGDEYVLHQGIFGREAP